MLWLPVFLKGQVQFSYLYDFEGEGEAGNNILPLKGGRYLISEFAPSYKTGKRVEQAAFFIIDSLGNRLLKKSYVFDTLLVRNGKMIALSDGNFADIRTLQDLDSNNNLINRVVLIKFDENLDTLWTKIYEDSITQNLIARTVHEHLDSGLIIVASNYHSSTNRNALLIKTNNMGRELHRREIPAARRGELYNISSFYDSGFYASGYINNSSADIFNPYVVKLDLDLNIIWKKDYPFSITSAPYNLVHSDSAVMLCTNSSLDKVAWRTVSRKQLIKIDSTGKILWQKIHDRLGYFTSYDKILKLANSTIIALGNYEQAYVSNGESYPTLTKLTPQGDTIWMHRLYYESLYSGQYLRDIALTPDGGFILAGDASSDSRPTQDIWVVKTDSNGCYTPSCHSRVYDIRLGINRLDEKPIRWRAYPNPVSETLNMELNNNESGNFQLFSLDGRLVLEGNLNVANPVDVSELPSATYELVIQVGTRVDSKLIFKK